MTVVISIGRRVPKSWFKRQTSKVKGLMTFQENMWQMIKQSMSLARRKANDAGKLKFVIITDKENEDMHYELEWLKVIIQGTKEEEKEEYEESLQMYQSLSKLFKKEMPKDDRMKQHFKSKVISSIKVEEAYKKGYGSVKDNNMANKLLEMGILTHIEWIKDFDSRTDEFRTDF